MSVPPAPRRRRVGVLLWPLVGLFGLWAVWCAWGIVSGARNAERGGNRLDRLIDEALLARSIDPEFAEKLRASAADLERAQERFGSIAITPLRALPVIGRQLRSASDLSSAAADVARDAATGADAMRKLAASPKGQRRLEAIDGLARAAGRLQETVSGVDLGPREKLVGSLAHARDEAADAVVDLRRQLSDATATLRALRRVYAGPSSVMVLAGNNAEMRAGHGALLSWGIADVNEGNVSFRTPMQSVGLFPKPAAMPAAARSLTSLWGWLDLSNIATLGTTARFDVTADRALDIYQAATTERPAVVVAVDSVAFDRMADVLGGLDLPGDPDRPHLDAEDVLGYLLHGQYENIPGSGPANLARRDRLADLAEAMLPRLLDLEGSPADIIDTIGELVAGRHLMLYSDVADLQTGWRGMSASGEMTPDSLSVAITNAGANKLDQFVKLDVSVSHRQVSGYADVAVDVTVKSEVPAGEPPYIVGQLPLDGRGRNAYAGLLTFTVPGDAASLTVDGVAAYAAVGVDGPSRVAAVRFDIVQGAEQHFVAHFRLPPGRTLRMIPPARVPVVEWKLDDYDDQGDQARVIQL